MRPEPPLLVHTGVRALGARGPTWRNPFGLPLPSEKEENDLPRPPNPSPLITRVNALKCCHHIRARVKNSSQIPPEGQ